MWWFHLPSHRPNCSSFYGLSRWCRSESDWGGHLKLQAEFGAGSSGPEQIHGTAIETDIISSRTKSWYSQSRGAAEGRISGMAVSMHTRSAQGHRHTINHHTISLLGAYFGLLCYVACLPMYYVCACAMWATVLGVQSYSCENYAFVAHYYAYDGVELC